MATALRRGASASRVRVTKVSMAVRFLARSSDDMVTRGSSSTVTLCDSDLPLAVSVHIDKPQHQVRRFFEFPIERLAPRRGLFHQQAFEFVCAYSPQVDNFRAR